MQYKSIARQDWDKWLEHSLLTYAVYAPLSNGYGLDYELIRTSDIPLISYNKPKPVTPLKNFFLPVRENVTSERDGEKPRMIIGIPNCDIEALGLIDEIYLDDDFRDQFYRKRRESTVLISTDCFGIQEHCHCLAYGIKPYSENKADLGVVTMRDTVILKIFSPRGEELVSGIGALGSENDTPINEFIEKEHKATEELLIAAIRELPDYKMTGTLVDKAGTGVWEKHSQKCVSCGACTTICPTCTCFLLIDKPGFEKVKQMDACQYPGFERVAGGEDGLFELHRRFRNRYMCKYVWKPQKFTSLACTGCGRCIEACIGKINKNEIFTELQKQAAG